MTPRTTVVLPDFFLPTKDTMGSGHVAMKAWMRGWSAARQPSLWAADLWRAASSSAGVLMFTNSLLWIAMAAIVHVQVPGVESGIDVEDARVPRTG